MNDQYLPYQLEDFLTDDAFVDWVVDGVADKDWQSWLKSHPERSAGIVEAKKIIRQLKFVEEPIDPEIKESIWNRIEEDTQTKEISLKKTTYRWYIGLAVAASLAFMVIFFTSDRATVIQTEMAMKEALILPSQSEVTLSALSEISFKENNWNSRRNVSLQGQGHFKVTKGVPFTVNTDNGTVRVLGTEFDVVSDNDAFQVLVTEGRVNASSDNHNKILTAGMAFFKNPSWEGTYELSPEWKTDNMYFAYKDEELSEVLKAISFAFDISIAERGVDTSMRYNGSFDSSEGLATSLEKVLWPLQIEYTISDNTIVLSTK